MSDPRAEYFQNVIQGAGGGESVLAKISRNPIARKFGIGFAVFVTFFVIVSTYTPSFMYEGKRKKRRRVWSRVAVSSAIMTALLFAAPIAFKYAKP